MGEKTGIKWTDHTFNPVWGCVKVSPACDYCYAEEWAARFSPGLWGPHGGFREFGDAHWVEPLRWNRAAEKAGERRRVFCASMADVFDNRWPERIRLRLWDLIRATPLLDWQLLTKRPQNVPGMLPGDWADGWPNVWLGTTVEDRTEAARRVPHLKRVPCQVRFLSCEPMLDHLVLNLTDIDWVICGGESGRYARAMNRTWVDALHWDCYQAGVPFFMKQVGSNHEGGWTGITGKGQDPAEWPVHLRVQEFPVGYFFMAGTPPRVRPV